jgi:hypothetical protein
MMDPAFEETQNYVVKVMDYYDDSISAGFTSHIPTRLPAE